MNKLKRMALPILGATMLVVLRSTAWADRVTVVTNQANQKADDSINWSQLGPDATALAASFDVDTAKSNVVTATLQGIHSLTAVVCPATPCSWIPGFAAGDTLLWTSDDANGGNGPLTLAFSNPVFGAGAMIKADSPGPFTVQIQALHNGKLLKRFTEKSVKGNPIYLGVLDRTAANITSVVFSLSACPKYSSCADFAIDAIQIRNTHP